MRFISINSITKYCNKFCKLAEVNDEFKKVISNIKNIIIDIILNGITSINSSKKRLIEVLKYNLYYFDPQQKNSPFISSIQNFILALSANGSSKDIANCIINIWKILNPNINDSVIGKSINIEDVISGVKFSPLAQSISQKEISDRDKAILILNRATKNIETTEFHTELPLFGTDDLTNKTCPTFKDITDDNKYSPAFIDEYIRTALKNPNSDFEGISDSLRFVLNSSRFGIKLWPKTLNLIIRDLFKRINKTLIIELIPDVLYKQNITNEMFDELIKYIPNIENRSNFVTQLSDLLYSKEISEHSFRGIYKLVKKAGLLFSNLQAMMAIKNIPSDVLIDIAKYIAQSNNDSYIDSILEMSNCTKECQFIFFNSYEHFKNILAKNKNTCLEVQLELAKLNNYLISLSLLGNENVFPEVVEYIKNEYEKLLESKSDSLSAMKAKIILKKLNEVLGKFDSEDKEKQKFIETKDDISDDDLKEMYKKENNNKLKKLIEEELLARRIKPSSII